MDLKGERNLVLWVKYLWQIFHAKLIIIFVFSAGSNSKLIIIINIINYPNLIIIFKYNK